MHAAGHGHEAVHQIYSLQVSIHIDNQPPDQPHNQTNQTPHGPSPYPRCGTRRTCSASHAGGGRARRWRRRRGRSRASAGTWPRSWDKGGDLKGGGCGYAHGLPNHSQRKAKHMRPYVHDGLPDEGELDLSANLGELLGVVAEDAEVLGVDVRLALGFD